MTTKTEVLNSTLVLLGQPRMSGPSDTSSWVRKVQGSYNSVVRLLLEDHPWNFATTRVALELVGVQPPIGREYRYNKPSDCIRINMINDTGSSDDTEIPDYDDEGGVILADMDPCYLFYISSSWLTKEGSWPEKFARAVACENASFNAELATKSAQKGISLEKRAAQALTKAKSWDASQKPWRRLPGGTWAGARRMGSRYRTDG